MEAAEVDPLLEVDLSVAGSLDRPRPVVMRVDVVRPDQPRLPEMLCHLRPPVVVFVSGILGQCGLEVEGGVGGREDRAPQVAPL